METGKLKINIEAGKTPTVEAEFVNNTLLITKNEIAKLFNCFPQRIEANLRSIFKSRLLWESEVTYIHRYTYRGVERQCIYYNLDVLIFLSYRIGTFETQIFRDFINQSFREHLKKKDKPQKCRILWIAPPCYN